MSLLFIDFDGVCHPDYYTVEFSKAKHLWTILRACPEVECVFSTSWREAYSMKHLIEFVTNGGGEDLAHRFVGTTPELDHSEYSFHREMECRAWLAENDQESRRWLAIDDIADWFAPPPNSNFYWVNPKRGLTNEDALAIIEILRGGAAGGGWGRGCSR